MRSILIALAICATGAALEALASGSGVRRRFVELRLPPYSPPLVLWVTIGLVYYGVCFVVMLRLLRAQPTLARSVAFALLLLLLAANAAWNYLFFRAKDLGASAKAFVPYSLLALSLLGLLAALDPIATWSLLGYVVYLPYAAWWLFALERANASST